MTDMNISRLSRRERAALFLGVGAISFLATVASADTIVSPVLLERRNAVEYEHGVENRNGELTYTVDSENRPNLYLGTTEGGTQIVSDPFAIHQPKTEEIADGSFAVEFVSDGISWNDDGSVQVFAGEGYATNHYTRTLRVRTVDGRRIAAVRSTNDLFNATASGHRNQDGSYDVDVSSTFLDMFDNPPRAKLSHFRVWVYSGERTEEEADLVAGDVLLHDSMGDVYFSKLREWTANRYDDRTAVDWAKYHANSDVYLDGHRVFFNRQLTLLTSMGGTNATAGLRFLANGSTVMEIVPGEVSADGSLRIVGFEYNSTNAVVYATSEYATPVYVQSAPAVRDVYEDLDGVVSSYPDKVEYSFGGTTVQAYRLVLPIDESEGSRFYRLRQESSGAGSNVVNLYGDVRINGSTVDDAIKAAIKELVTTGLVIDGVRYTVQATAVPEE